MKIDADTALELLKRVDVEFDRLSDLDSPESVNPDPKLWDDITKSLQQTHLKTLCDHEYVDTEYDGLTCHKCGD